MASNILKESFMGEFIPQQGQQGLIIFYLLFMASMLFMPLAIWQTSIYF